MIRIKLNSLKVVTLLLIFALFVGCSNNKNERVIYLVSSQAFDLTELSKIINNEDTIGEIKRIDLLPSNKVLLELKFDSLVVLKHNNIQFQTKNIVFEEKSLELILKLKSNKDYFSQMNWGDTLFSDIKLNKNNSVDIKGFSEKADSLIFKLEEIADSLPQIINRNFSNYLNSP